LVTCLTVFSEYVNPMLQKLDSLAEFSVRSQVLYYVKLNVSPKLNSVTGVYEIPFEQLPLVINPVESKLSECRLNNFRDLINSTLL
jgi:hypothetical protein